MATEKLALAGIPVPESSALTPLQLLQMAVVQGTGIEQLERLMALQERWEANEAKKAYVEAMNAFKSHPPTILKTKQVSFDNTNYKHATLDGICDAVIGALSAVGISHRWATRHDEKTIMVTCVLTHKLGHSEETTLSGPADVSGSKNAIQAIGSAVTYLQRYTLMAACGLAAGEDDDGRGAIHQEVLSPRLSELRIQELCEWIMNSKEDELQKFWELAKGEAVAAQNGPALNRIRAAKDKRKKELGL